MKKNFAVKEVPALLRGITSKHHGDFSFLNYLHSFARKNKLEPHEKVYRNKDFCRIALPTQKIVYHNLVNTCNQIKCCI